MRGEGDDDKNHEDMWGDSPIRQVETDEPDDNLILEQLKKTKANVSIWELLMHSSSHRKALVKALTNMNIQINVTPKAMVARVTKNKQRVITFSDADLPPKGRNHNKALFIPAEVKGKKTNYVMVDDGSAINVCPLKILPNLGVKVEELTKLNLVMGFRKYTDSCK